MPPSKEYRMEPKELLRVVALHKGKVKPVEFRMREGEIGLSLFARAERPSATDVVDAVRAMGKQGDLAIAVISAREITALGLSIVRTPGGTPVPEVNAIHFEARLPFLRSLLVRLRGTALHEYFNHQFSDRLFEVAQVLQ